MTKAQHTLGRWKISQEPPRWIIQADGALGKKAVAYMVGDFVDCAANARLIAAAPDLLEVLRYSLEMYDTNSGDIAPWADCWDKMRDAIAKATGVV